MLSGHLFAQLSQILVRWSSYLPPTWAGPAMVLEKLSRVFVFCFCNACWQAVTGECAWIQAELNSEWTDELMTWFAIQSRSSHWDFADPTAKWRVVAVMVRDKLGHRAAIVSIQLESCKIRTLISCLCDSTVVGYQRIKVTSKARRPCEIL